VNLDRGNILPDERTNLLVILGPTASGKTRLAVDAARFLNGEVISADSRQVFRGLDIGSGKDLAEYQEIPYHLIDIIDPGQEFSLFAFAGAFCEAFAAIRQRGRLPVLVGGTGLYLDALLRGYRLVEVPENPALRRELAGASLAELQARLKSLRRDLHNSTDLNDRERVLRAIEIAQGETRPDTQPLMLPELRSRIYGIFWPRQVLRQRITERLKTRLQEGLIEEVARLHEQGISWQTLEFYGLEYRYVALHLQGVLTRNDLFQKLNSAIHQFAKRQDTWFRRMQKQGVAIRWLNGAADPLAEFIDDWRDGS
jgi:tRNA dimethylallyltransferase